MKAKTKTADRPSAQNARQRTACHLIAFRLAVASASTAAGYFFYHPTPPFYAIMACFFAGNLLALLFLRHRSGTRLVSQVQLVADVVLITCLVHYTGGIDSVFVFLYPLCIVAAAAEDSGELLPQSIAGASALFFGLIVVLEFTGVLDHFGGRMTSYSRGPWLVAFLYFFRVFIFGLVSAVSGLLMRRLQSERTRTQRLEDASNRLIGNMNHGVITVDAQDRIVFANAYALEILQRDVSELSGKDWRTLFHSAGLPDEDGAEQALESWIMDPLHHEWRVMIRCPGGAEKAVGFIFSDQCDDKGQLVNKVIMFRDMTELIKARKKLKADEKWVLLGELAGSIVHEIRNPLSAIRGSVEVLSKRHAFGDKDKALLRIVLQESDRLNGILEDYLTCAGKNGAQRKVKELAECLDPLLCLLQGHPRFRKDVRLRWDKPKEKLWVCVDEQQIRQVMLNIIQNALDAMPAGGELALRMAISGGDAAAEAGPKVSAMGQWARVDIEDTGQGMTPEVMERLYEPFFSTKQNGHGIGLSLCRRIVERHQGFLKVCSAPGKGTVFSLYLPFAPEAMQREYRAQGA